MAEELAGKIANLRELNDGSVSSLSEDFPFGLKVEPLVMPKLPTEVGVALSTQKPMSLDELESTLSTFKNLFVLKSNLVGLGRAEKESILQYRMMEALSGSRFTSYEELKKICQFYTRPSASGADKDKAIAVAQWYKTFNGRTPLNLFSKEVLKTTGLDYKDFQKLDKLPAEMLNVTDVKNKLTLLSRTIAMVFGKDATGTTTHIKMLQNGVDSKTPDKLSGLIFAQLQKLLVEAQVTSYDKGPDTIHFPELP